MWRVPSSSHGLLGFMKNTAEYCLLCIILIFKLFIPSLLCTLGLQIAFIKDLEM